MTRLWTHSNDDRICLKDFLSNKLWPGPSKRNFRYPHSSVEEFDRRERFDSAKFLFHRRRLHLRFHPPLAQRSVMWMDQD